MKKKYRVGSYEEFRNHMYSILRGEHKVAPDEPKIWYECDPKASERSKGVRFRSFEAGSKLLSAKNRSLLRIIADSKPQSVSELAELTGRAEQNVLRTLSKFCEAGIVRLDKGKGRALRPILLARKILFEIDLLASA